MKTYIKAKKAYSEILKTVNKHKDVCIFSVDDLERKSNYHLYGLELKEIHGLDIEPEKINRLDWNRFGDYMSIGIWGTEHNRTISWSVDGRQPENETLLQISFPTGAYIFGTGGIFNKDYPTEFFQKFWLELKTYKPKYIDEANNSLYWNIKDAKQIFNSFNDILDKYYELNNEDIKRRRIEKMKKELEQLEGNS